jgi:uncharacterized coiled-coil protein SlyX
MSNVLTIKRRWARAGEAVRSFGKRMKSRLLAMTSSKADDGVTDPVPNGEAGKNLQAIMERRKRLEAQIEAAARQGFVQDGLSMCLLDNFNDELAERRRLLGEVEHQLQACLRRLEAIAPPPKPEPELRAEPRKRRFNKPSDWFPKGAPGLAE